MCPSALFPAVARTLFLTIPALFFAVPVRATPGDPDYSFRDFGWTTIPTTGYVAPTAVAVQPDGKILVAANVETAGRTLAVVYRFLADGTLDSSFGSGGRATPPISHTNSAGSSTANAIALQNDGKIVIAGGLVDVPNIRGYMMARLLANGDPDTGFGTLGDGHAYIPLPNAGEARGVAVLPDGKILVTGDAYFTLRCQPDGTQDLSFGTDGRGQSAGGRTRAMLVQGDGKILTAGTDSNENMLVTRSLPDGTPDETFGTSSSTTSVAFSSGGVLRGLSLQPDGKIVGAGTLTNGTVGVFRLTSNGSFDPSFNATGRTTIPFSLDVRMLALQNNGRILVAGTLNATAGSGDTGIIRLNTNGTPDSTFGSGGKVSSDAGAGNEMCYAGTLLPNRKLFIAGYYDSGGIVPSGILLERFVTVEGPALSVENTAGTVLPAGGTTPVDLGKTTATVPIVREFAVKNYGAAPLTGLSVTVAPGGPPGEFAVTTPAPATLSAGAGGTFSVTFTPGAATGLRTAAVHVASNDPDFNPYTINVAAFTATALENWRFTWFGSTENTGSGADLLDFDSDGMVNILEFALRANPTQAGPAPAGEYVKNVSGGLFTYMRPSAAAAAFSYQVERTTSADGTWSAAGPLATEITDDGIIQTVKVTVPPPLGTKQFVRLRVTRL